LHHYQWWLQVT